MTKNKLEKKFSEVMRANPNIWGMKLHNNPLTHQNTPADFILHIKHLLDVGQYTVPDSRSHLVLVECKQVTCEPGENGRLAFKRLKQFHDLLAFEQFSSTHNSFICIAFKESFWSKSDVYMVPAKSMRNYVESCHKVSINRDEMKIAFPEYRVDIDNINWGELIDRRPDQI